MHLDIAGIGGVVDGSGVPYLAKGIEILVFYSNSSAIAEVRFLV